MPGGNKFDLSLGGDDELKEVELSRRQATFSYKDGDAFVFMDDEDYTPYTLDADVVGDAAGYISDGLAGCYVQIIDDAAGRAAAAAERGPGSGRDAAGTQGRHRHQAPEAGASLNTGIEIQVPEYIGNGERVWVNTTTGEFAGRAD